MDLEYHIKAWSDAMEQTEYYSLDKSTPEQISGLWDRLSESYDDTLDNDRLRVESVMGILERTGALTSNTVAIDIGCGTGSFTLELAKKCKRVYAFDLSPQMLEKLRKKAKGYSNIIPISGNWKTIDTQTLDSDINLALSCLNPGISDFEGLSKMNTVSKGWCCYINALGSSIGSNASRNELQEIILGRKLKSAGGNSVVFALNIITAMGYKPELWEIPYSWCRSAEKENAIDNISNDFGRFTTISDEIRQKIADYVESNLDDNGLFVQSVNTTLGTITWQCR